MARDANRQPSDNSSPTVNTSSHATLSTNATRMPAGPPSVGQGVNDSARPEDSPVPRVWFSTVAYRNIGILPVLSVFAIFLASKNCLSS